MTLAPDENELRVRDALRARIDGVPPPVPPSRPRDWLDDIMDDAPAPAVPPPPPPAVPPVPAAVPAEPRWDWRRLRRWPNFGIKARLCCTLVAVAAPILPGGYCTATTWWYCVHQARHNYGMGYGYALGGAALAVAIAAVTSKGKRAGLLRVIALAIAAIGFIGAISWADPITLITGASR